MRASRPLIAILAILLLLQVSWAATLHGKIYDIELNELNGVVVEVDSEPAQRYVSKDGAYSFELNPGNYTITATYSPDRYSQYSTNESFSIKQEGDYVFDLFLFPEIDEGDEELLAAEDVIEVPEQIIEENEKISGITIAIIVVVAIIILLVIYYAVGCIKEKEEDEELKEADKARKLAKESMKKELEDSGKHKKRRGRYADIDKDLHKVLDFLKKEGGRATQKELRKEIPLSEAKISLMISELEHKGMIKKVKKGRGNILILKKG